MGKVESGTLRMDDEVAIAPTKKKAKVDAIYVGDDKVRSAKVQRLPCTLNEINLVHEHHHNLYYITLTTPLQTLSLSTCTTTPLAQRDCIALTPY